MELIDYQKENLSHIVEDYIKNLILSGVYKEGDRVLETDIADNLKISRGPVREGIRTLEQEGILTVEPRKGAYVTRFGMDDINEVFEIRLLLENTILEDLIYNHKLTEQDFKDMERIIEDMVDIAKGPQGLDERTLGINRKDIEFHKFIWKKSGSKRKENILNSIFFQLRMAMLYDTKKTGDLLVTATDHYEIVKYLRSGDLEKCKQALKAHIITCDEERKKLTREEA